ncbi:YciI family protein [Sciscionella marina]|uniref:YciI family protein n=1 Tax=Sciscionella marina TaxID=508770 RepID=UPI0003624C2C|nr:YciI family protein [Sciscionella marina]
MKYMIMLYASQADHDALSGRPGSKPAWSQEEIAALHEHMGKIHTELAESGELVDAQPLAQPVHTRRLHSRDGVPVVTDGPYAETQEVLAGYTIVDCSGMDRATEIGFEFASAPGPEGATDTAFLDIRPLGDGQAEL